MRLLAYQGVSAFSRLIRWQTRSRYSHIALQGDSSVIEAWLRGGVQEVGDFRTLHTPGTVVDVYEVVKPMDTRMAWQWSRRQVGLPYDWRGVARFVSRRPGRLNRRWFCSELAAEACAVGGVDLLHLPTWECSPRDVAASPMLRQVETWTV